MWSSTRRVCTWKLTQRSTSLQPNHSKPNFPTFAQWPIQVDSLFLPRTYTQNTQVSTRSQERELNFCNTWLIPFIPKRFSQLLVHKVLIQNCGPPQEALIALNPLFLRFNDPTNTRKVSWKTPSATHKHSASKLHNKTVKLN